MVSIDSAHQRIAIVKTIAVLLAKTYLGIFLSFASIVIFFYISGVLNFQSTSTFKLIGCNADIVSVFDQNDDISFNFIDQMSSIPNELIYTTNGLIFSEQEYSELSNISRLLSDNGCEVTDVTLERGHILSSSAASDFLSLFFIFSSSILIFIVFKKSIIVNRPYYKRLNPLFVLYGICGAFVAGLILNVYMLFTGNNDEFIAADSILSDISIFDAILIGVLFIPLYEEIIFRRILLELWINSNYAGIGSVLISLLFAALHAIIPQDILPSFLVFIIIFCLSFGCCYAYFKSGLLGSWLLHSSYNLVLIVSAYFLPKTL